MKEDDLTGCMICASNETRPDIEKNGFQYVVCSGCGVSMIDPMPEQETLDELYQKGFMELSCGGVSQADHFSAEYRETYFAEKDLDFSDLAYEFSGNNMRVLDVGSANGLFLDYLLKRQNIRGEGIDVSKEMTEAGVAGGFDCKCMKIEDVVGSYDMLTMWDTLEHMRDPLECLKDAKRILKPSGDIIIQTPCRGVISDSYKADWIQYQPPYHVHIFDFESLKFLLAKTGFSVVRWVRFGSGITDTDLPVKSAIDRVAKEMDIGDTIVIWGRKE